MTAKKIIARIGFWSIIGAIFSISDMVTLNIIGTMLGVFAFIFVFGWCVENM